MFLLLLLACSGGTDEPSCAEGGSGTLSIRMDLPGEAWATAPAVEVFNAAGASMGVLDEPGTLDLPGGSYIVAALRGTVDEGAIGRAYGLLADTAATVCVADGETVEWEGEWTLQPSSEKLWVLSREAAYAFDAAALDAGGPVEPALTIEVPRSNDLRGLAVDAMGNLWIATAPTYGTRLLVYAPGGVDGSVEPMELSGGAFDPDDWVQVTALGFSGKRDLWVLVKGSYSSDAAVWGFDLSQAFNFVATGEPPTLPSSRLTVEGLDAPDGLTIDGSDHVWLADLGSDRVFDLGSGLGRSGDTTVTPGVAFTAGWEDDTGTHSLSGPTAVGFDPEGRLWVNYWTNPLMARFDAADATADNWTPDLRVGGSVLDLPAGLALDRAGRVWYGNEPQNGTGELVALDTDDGTERLRLSSAAALSPSTLVFDPGFR